MIENLAILVNGIVLLAVLTVICLRSYYLAFVFVFLISWTAESFIGYGVIPDHFPDLLCIYVILIMLYKLLFSMGRRPENAHFRAPVLAILSLFLVTCVVSAIINGTGLLRMLLFARYFLLFYLFFVIVINADLDDNTVRMINAFIIFLFLIQVPVGTLKWILHVGRGYNPAEFGSEGFTGTYAVHGGSLAVLIPLIAIGFIVPMYFNRSRLIYLCLFMSFIWFTLIGSKRATFFVLPVFLIFIFYFMRDKFEFRIKKLLVSLAIAVLSLLLIATLNYTLNPEKKIGGSIDLGHIFKYAVNYTTGSGFLGPTKRMGNVEEYGFYTFGRISSTRNIIERLLRSKPATMLFGYGPGSGLKSGLVSNTHRSFFLKLRIESGVTGFIWVVSQVGVLGAALFLYLLFRLFILTKRSHERIADPYWNIFIIGTLGTFFIFFFDFLCYSEAFIRGEHLLFLFYYLTAISIRKGAIPISSRFKWATHERVNDS